MAGVARYINPGRWGPRTDRADNAHAGQFECRYRLELDYGANDGLVARMTLQATGICAGDHINLEQMTPLAPSAL